eukprot:3136446-Rhodomonas_salina.1
MALDGHAWVVVLVKKRKEVRKLWWVVVRESNLRPIGASGMLLRASAEKAVPVVPAFRPPTSWRVCTGSRPSLTCCPFIEPQPRLERPSLTPNPVLLRANQGVHTRNL